MGLLECLVASCGRGHDGTRSRMVAPRSAYLVMSLLHMFFISGLAFGFRSLTNTLAIKVNAFASQCGNAIGPCDEQQVRVRRANSRLRAAWQ